MLDTRGLAITSVELLPDTDVSATAATAQKLEFHFGETHEVGGRAVTQLRVGCCTGTVGCRWGEAETPAAHPHPPL